MRKIFACVLVIFSLTFVSADEKAQLRGKELLSFLESGPKPSWVWAKSASGVPDRIWLRKSFTVKGKVSSARFYGTCDNQMRLFLNGKDVGFSNDWPHPLIDGSAVDLVKKGKNTIAIEANNTGGIAAFLFKLEVKTAEGEATTVVSSTDWKVTKEKPANQQWVKADFSDLEWKNELVQIQELGKGPWGIPEARVAKTGGSSQKPSPTLPKDITTLDDFEVDLLYTVPREEQGSWVSLTKDPKGRFYASDQGGKGLFRISVAERDEGPNVSVEPIPIQESANKVLSGAQGLEWAFDGLYFHKNGGGFYKLTDSDGDDLLDQAELLPGEHGGGEHGNHAVTVSEDGQGLYVVGGNHAATPPEESIVRQRMTGWDEDLLLPRQWDARGHARGRLAPGGWVSRFDPVKKQHDLISVGYRNQYDVALNAHGDLFTYDADMEWDLGMPWYRPTRICLVASGTDYGWRSGTGKWPTYYEDSAPPAVEIGPGCPTGVLSGMGSRFPARYQEAIYALDWTFGTIYAIHLQEDGAGYKGSSEPFVYGSPLAVTDADLGDDGHFYFLVGGRNSQSALYRVRYVGEESTAAIETPEPSEALQLRRDLEKYHGIEDPEAVATAWPHLASKDRWIRHAARVAVESQPVDSWTEKVYGEKNAQARIAGAVALARVGNSAHREPLLAALQELDPADLSEGEMLGLLRAYALNFIRLGSPSTAESKQIGTELEAFFPSENKDINTELVRLLVYLQSPNIVGKTLDLIATNSETEIPDWTDLAKRNERYGGTILKMLENHPPTRQIEYAFMLRNAQKGWNVDNRRAYFEFLNSAAQYPGGASYPGFLTNMRAEALTHCSDEERAALSDVTGEDFNPVPDFPINPPEGPGRNWALGEAVGQGSRNGANFERGRSLYFAVGCGACHRHAGLGGGIGPDLTSIPNKFDVNYLMESIIDPSKDISDQYGSSIVTMKDGAVHQGIAIEKGEDLEIYLPDPKAKATVVKRSEVKSIEQSPVSQMPGGLINSLNPDELRDLTAYLMSGGNPEDRKFRK